jgi:hypothetical protein
LFGRNHTAGAILIESNKAQITDGNEGYAKSRHGRLQHEAVSRAWPICRSTTCRQLRMSPTSDFKRDGYTRNLASGQMFDGSDEKILRLSYLIKPTSQLSSHFVYDSLQDDGGPISTLLSDVFRPQISAANLAVFGPAVGLQQKLGPRQFYSPYGTGIGGFGNTTQAGNDLLNPTQCLINPGNTICRKHAQPVQEIESKRYPQQHDL